MIPIKKNSYIDSKYSKFKPNDVFGIIKALPESKIPLGTLENGLLGKGGEGFVGLSIIRVIEDSNCILWVVVTKDGKIAYQVKSAKWICSYYELIEDADEFYVVWDDKHQIVKYYLIESTD